LAVAFALEALPSEEGDAYRTHLGNCGLCQQLVGQFQTVADLLPDALEEEPASPTLKERILAQARRELESEAREAPAGLLQRWRVRVSWRWPARITPRPMVAIAILALVVVGLVAWNVILQLRLDGRGELTSGQLDLIEAIAGGAGVSRLSGTEMAPEASGTLVQVPGEGKAFLLVRNLPRLPSGHEYQVWRIKGKVPASAGTFALADDGDQLITLYTDFSDAEAVGVRVERIGGSPTPTGPIVLLGSF